MSKTEHTCVIIRPSTTTDLSSPRTLWAARIDGLVYLNLLPNKKTALLLGTGGSFVHCSQNYRSYYQVDFDDLNQGTIINETYVDEASDSFGIPVALHLGIPLSSNWHITGTVSSAFYRNSDVFFLATAGLAYQW